MCLESDDEVGRMKYLMKSLAPTLHFCNGSTVKFVRRQKNKKGQTLVEYALILAFISVVAISVLVRLGAEVKEIFTTITSQLAIAGSSH
jgi:Flp pilus assembly pilin Flp